MKHGFELVINGLKAMQGCSILSHAKTKPPGSYREIHNYGDHPTPQNNKYTIYSLQKQHKIVSCVNRISIRKINQI